jgi:hypothetical protein
MLLGAMEGAMSRAAAKEGLQLLTQAEELDNKLRSKGQYFPVAEVQNIDTPQPQKWVAFADRDEPYYGNLPVFKRAREEFIQKNRVSVAGDSMTITREIAFVHSGQEFVLLEERGQVVFLRWSSVTEYRVRTKEHEEEIAELILPISKAAAIGL